MFVSSTVVTAVWTRLYLREFTPCRFNPSNCHDMSASIDVIEWPSRVNYILNDALVVYRAWVLWPNNRTARGVLLLCMFCSFVGTVIECVWRTYPVFDFPRKVSVPGLMGILLFITNLTATTLIGIRFWIYRKDVRAWIAPLRSTRTRVETILMLLLESGVIYCALWAFFLVTIIPPSGLKHSYDPTQIAIFRVFDDILYLLSGIYPTFVVVVGVLHQQSTGMSTIGAQSKFLESLRILPECDTEECRREARSMSASECN
ncbi:uncharacterized protein SCHCODRAFT_02523364 [Schizophyllum commune H4-8]|uniref:uncharacterized protein n=1 Tax=Schizophyllum commune (strain H4-8 / FGSC 9210) TaxID=578458 RepID=UPI0021601705|nr:uncharacterized protein SCHCODRAFT_02523364 [Schizophyllum commune H4-8]KAI5899196.1 hypothetical protein SCHCODRAFT_02523364 [Schizophyllum commune H4-8]